MPTRLSEELVADALTALPGWTGDTDRISRTVQLPPEEAAKLKTAVAESADSMNHHPVVEDGEGTTTYALWTHSEGGVTELDIALAARIDDLVLQVTGVPAGMGNIRVHERDEDVIADQRKSAYPHHHGGRGEPFMGVPAGSGGMPATPMPDTAPFEPEPGVESPEGRQGGGPG